MLRPRFRATLVRSSSLVACAVLVPAVAVSAGSSSCCSPGASSGCDDATCEKAVCAIDPFCCDSNWDDLCAIEAAELCAVCGGGPVCNSACPADLDFSGAVDGADIGLLFAAWAPAGAPAGACEDLDGDGNIDGADLGILLAWWGPCPQPPCPFICSGSPEGELCGDDDNGGCNASPPSFEPIECEATICGTAWADAGSRDTDWYQFTLSSPTRVICAIDATLPMVLGIVNTGGVPDCALGGTLLTSVTTSFCSDASFTICLPAGTWWLFAAPNAFEGFPCGVNNEYAVSFTCDDACLPPGCGSAGHDCFTAGGPFCDDQACCELVCADDPFCCEVAWDLICVQQAEAMCDAPLAVDLDVDTNRDGAENGADEEGEDVWKKTRGALFLVNCDDDDGDKKSDSVRYDKDEKVVVVDEVINNDADKQDITPLVVRQAPPLAGRKLFLDFGDLDQLKAVHVFKKIAAGETKIAGGPTAVVGDVSVDITELVKNTDGNPVETTFGLEGLKFRALAGGGMTADMIFKGKVLVTLRLVDVATGKSLATDTVELKVAPYLMLPNSQESEKLFVQEFAGNAQFIMDLNTAIGMAHVTKYATDSAWPQDDCEIGYTESPRNSLRVAAYTRHHDNPIEVAGGLGDAQWILDKVIGADIGFYRNPFSLPADARDVAFDYGGNLELIPPTTHHKLGQICVGKDMSDRKKRFLESQEVQGPLVEVDTAWLSVGHVDEIVSFWKPAGGGADLTVVLASPKKAYAIIDAVATPSEDSEGPGLDPGTMFASGPKLTGTVSFAGGGMIKDPSKNFIGNEPYHWVRIYDGPGAGNVAHVAQLIGDTIIVDQVWAPFEPTDHQFMDLGGAPSAGILDLVYTPATGPDFFPDTDGFLPTTGSKYILVEDTLMWKAPTSPLAGVVPGNTPAFCTLDEIKNKFVKTRAINMLIATKIADARQRIKDAVAPDKVKFIEVPLIYTGTETGGALDKHGSVAWTPGSANIQYAKGKLLVAKQVADKNGAEIFGPSITTALGLVVNTDLFYIDDAPYHAGSGEVHCGTNVLRKKFAFKWWE